MCLYDDEGSIYNQGSGGGGGGGGDSKLYDFQIQDSSNDAAQPIKFNNGVLGSKTAYQFSQTQAIDITDLVIAEINLKIRFSQGASNKGYIYSWSGLGNRFIKVFFTYSDTRVLVSEFHFAKTFNAWKFLSSWTPSIYENDLFGKWNNIKILFNTSEKFVQFFLNGVGSVKGTFTDDVYKNSYALGVGSSFDSLNAKQIPPDVEFDLKNCYFKKNNEIVWGNEE